MPTNEPKALVARSTVDSAGLSPRDRRQCRAPAPCETASRWKDGNGAVDAAESSTSWSQFGGGYSLCCNAVILQLGAKQLRES